MKKIWFILIVLLGCNPEIVYLDKLYNPGNLEIHNQMFGGWFMLSTNDGYNLADTIVPVHWFEYGDERKFVLEENVYRITLDLDGVGHGSWSVPVYRDSTTVKILHW